MVYPGITWYKSGPVGISRDTSALISGISRDIPVSAFLERVIRGYPDVCMLKIADSGLLNALTLMISVSESRPRGPGMLVRKLSPFLYQNFPRFWV